MALTIAALLLALCAFTAAASPVDDYIEARDAYIAGYDHGRDAGDQAAPAADLTRRLGEIVGPLRMRGFHGAPQLNAESLARGDAGFDNVDGLRWRFEGKVLFATTRELLARWLKDQPALPQQAEALAENEDFLFKAVGQDAHIDVLARVPVRAKRGTFARAMLALSAQDTGPFPPNTLVVFVATRRRVLVVSRPFRLPQLEHCRIHAAVLEKYQACYARGIRHGATYERLKHRVQEMVNRLPAAP